MRPRMNIPLSPADRATIAMWSRRVLAVWAVIVASLVAYAFLAQREPATAKVENPQQHAKSSPVAPRGQR
jgi:hypothetical protein